ncbi:hypothetical protein RSSM_03779 [Rhodopirellula sallentina SM41]|uniref:Uncharacterized protein n=1 Tax=Rhodopirellula sallentina SM41 TaxID=1263870 RepID=M5U001_9BACT|nr:hypothetical protein RSSM_03779 [Rhodopirellula sallentina SM41]
MLIRVIAKVSEDDCGCHDGHRPNVPRCHFEDESPPPHIGVAETGE